MIEEKFMPRLTFYVYFNTVIYFMIVFILPFVLVWPCTGSEVGYGHHGDGHHGEELHGDYYPKDDYHKTHGPGSTDESGEPHLRMLQGEDCGSTLGMRLLGAANPDFKGIDPLCHIIYGCYSILSLILELFTVCKMK